MAAAVPHSVLQVHLSFHLKFHLVPLSSRTVGGRGRTAVPEPSVAVCRRGRYVPRLVPDAGDVLFMLRTIMRAPGIACVQVWVRIQRTGGRYGQGRGQGQGVGQHRTVPKPRNHSMRVFRVLAGPQARPAEFAPHQLTRRNRHTPSTTDVGRPISAPRYG